jgi:hypothetical protein
VSFIPDDESQADPFGADRAAASPEPSAESAPAAETSGPQNFGDVQAEARELADTFDPDAPDDGAETGRPAEEKYLTIREADYLAHQAEQQRRVEEYVAGIQQKQSQDQAVAAELVRQHHDIMSNSDDADSYDAWEKYRREYPQKVAQAEATYWRNRSEGQQQQAYNQRANAEMSEYLPHLTQNVHKFSGEVLQSVRGQLNSLGLDDAAQAAWGQRFAAKLLAEAEEGRIFYHTGEKIQGTTLPHLDVDFGHIATMAAREIETIRQFREIENAARVNAEAEARRRGTGFPPGITARQDYSARSRTGGDPSETWAALMDSVLHED